MFTLPFVVAAIGLISGNHQPRLLMPSEAFALAALFSMDRATRSFQGDDRPAGTTDFLGVLWVLLTYVFAFGAGYGILSK